MDSVLWVLAESSKRLWASRVGGREGLQVITSDLWVLPKASWSIFRASPPGNQGWLVSPRLRTLFLSELPIPLFLIV